MTADDAARIGAAIRRAREYCDVTLTDLAERVGVAKSTMSKHENGHIPVPPERLTEIEGHLGLWEGTLLALSGTDPNWTVWHLLAEIDPQSHRHLVRLAEHLVLRSDT